LQAGRYPPADDRAGEDIGHEGRVGEARPGPDVRVGVGSRRGAGLSVGPSPRPALRTGRATLTASGSPRAHAAAGDPDGSLAQGVGIRLPRYR
jgi:hypothetical protein